MIRFRLAPALAGVALGATIALAQGPAAGSLKIEAPWLRATPNGAKVAAGYLKVTNAGPQADTLVGGNVPFAGKVEVHEMAMSSGVMKMRPLESGLEVPAGGSVELKPGGYHLMFMDLSAGLKEGQSVQGTLTFKRAGDVPVTFSVGGMGAAMPAGGMHH